MLTYIKKEDVRQIASRLLDEAKTLSNDISIDPLQWGKSVKYKGSVLFYWEPRQACIRISTYGEDGEWEGSNISSDEQYTQMIEQIKSNLKSYDK